VELWSVEGEERSSGLPLSILCALNGPGKNYVLQLIFGDSYRQRRLGRFWLWNVVKAIPKTIPDCSMIFGDFCDSHRKFTGSSDWFVMPIWLLGEVALPRDAKADRKIDRDLRRIRQQAFQFEVTRDLQQFDDFYHNMYVPHISQTFGECALVASYEHLKAIFQSCNLLLIKNQEGIIAGQMIRYQPRGPFLYEMGVRDGNRTHVKNGVGSACYHFGMQYLQEKGYPKAFLGWSRPFLRDGVLQFKRNWSQRIVDSYPNGFALRILSHTPATMAFLRNNPFIFRHDNGLYAAVFVDMDKRLSVEDIQQIDKNYFHPGLERILVYCPRREQTIMQSPMAAELAERIELRCLDDLAGNAS
jgi:hypothetical protein